MSNQTTQDSPQLLRKMNLLDSTFLVIGAIVGSGIFMTTGFIAEYLPSPLMILIVWLLGGFFAICGALDFGYFAPALSTKAYFLKFSLLGSDYSLSAGQLVAVASILFLSAINYIGIKSGIVVQNIFTFLRIAAVAVLIVLGLTVGSKAGVVSFSGLLTGDISFSIRLFGLAFIAVLWTYDGWYGINCAAEEIKNPGKNIPRGLILGTLSVTLIYFLVNIVYVTALPVERMKGVIRIGELASTQLFGPTATLFISGTIMISIFGCLSASILYGPRVFFAMAQDRCFFKSMRYVHPRYRVPTKAIVWQGIWSSLLCLTGTYQDLFEYVVFALVIFWAATGLAVIILRFKQPEIPRPYKTWGYPVLPILFVLINLGVFLNTIWVQPLQSLIGLIILIAGIPAFLYWQSKVRAAS
jgi:APA family basic amino acid/polyamine antiporter